MATRFPNTPTSHPPQCLFVGAAHLDRNGVLFDRSELGKSNPGRFKQFAGGAAFNVASIFAAHGGVADLCSILGQDEAAKIIESACRQRAIGFHPQKSDAFPTASYTAIMEPDGQLAIAVADMSIYEAFDSQLIEWPQEEQASETWLCIAANLPHDTIAKVVEKTSGPCAGLTTSSAKAGSKGCKCVEKRPEPPQ